MRAQIPNALTMLNLFCGCAGLVMAFTGRLEYASYLIWTAAVFDFLDGFSARMLKIQSKIGKELDSLADMVTFGVLPGSIMFVLVSEKSQQFILPYLAFSLAIFAAIRLAKFNLDTQQTHTFRGLPTPATAFFVSSFPFIMSDNFMGLNDLLGPEILLVICILLSLLMVARLPLMSLKFADFTWRNNRARYILIILSGILLFQFKVIAFTPIILLYVLISLVSKID